MEKEKKKQKEKKRQSIAADRDSFVGVRTFQPLPFVKK